MFGGNDHGLIWNESHKFLYSCDLLLCIVLWLIFRFMIISTTENKFVGFHTVESIFTTITDDGSIDTSSYILYMQLLYINFMNTLNEFEREREDWDERGASCIGFLIGGWDALASPTVLFILSLGSCAALCTYCLIDVVLESEGTFGLWHLSDWYIRAENFLCVIIEWEQRAWHREETSDPIGSSAWHGEETAGPTGNKLRMNLIQKLKLLG